MNTPDNCPHGIEMCRACPQCHREAAHGIIRSLCDALAFVRPLAMTISEDGGEPQWRRQRAQESIGKIDAALVAADAADDDRPRLAAAHGSADCCRCKSRLQDGEGTAHGLEGDLCDECEAAWQRREWEFPLNDPSAATREEAGEQP